jgi:hypothetical protein
VLTIFCLVILVAWTLDGCKSKPVSFHFEKVREISITLDEHETVCNVYDLAVDNEWYMYLADRTCHAVWVLDERGTKFARIGGKGGSGPGELGAPTSVALLGDTVAILEAANHRVSFFSRSGTYLYSFRLKETGQPSGIEVGPHGILIVSESIGLRNFDFYSLDGRLLRGSNIKTTSPILLPVRLPGGHMSLTSDGEILFSFIREYDVIRINWNGEVLARYRAEAPGYQPPALNSLEESTKQQHFSIVGLPLQIDDVIVVQWFRRSVHPNDKENVQIERYADVFTVEGEPLQLAIPLPHIFLSVRDEYIFGINVEPIGSGAFNPSIVVYRIVRK